MYKRKLGVMGGALLVVLSMVVIGCKGLGSGDEDVESVKKYAKIWPAENSSATNYRRFFEQFGLSKKVKTATVELKVSNAKESRAGLVFGLNENENNTVSFYVLGVGADNSSGDPLYYLDYYDALDPKAMSQSTSNDKLGSNPVSLVGADNDGIEYFSDPNVKVAEDGSMSVVVQIDMADKSQIKVSIGSAQNKMMTEIDPFEHRDSGAKDALGGIGAYGMLRPTSSAATPVKTVNSYTVLESDPNRVFLAAEDAE